MLFLKVNFTSGYNTSNHLNFYNGVITKRSTIKKTAIKRPSKIPSKMIKSAASNIFVAQSK